MSLIDLLALRPNFKNQDLDTADLDKAIARIYLAFPDASTSIPDNADAVIRRVVSALYSQDWQSVTTGDVAVALRAHLTGKSPVPADLRRFLDAEAEVTSEVRLLDAIAQAYLEGWEPDSSQTTYLHRLIVSRTEKLPGHWQILFTNFPEFLDLAAGPRLIGKRMTHVDSPYRWLRDNGLSAPHGPGFMRHVHAAFLIQSRDPETLADLERLLAWASPPGSVPLDDNRAAEIVDLILSPWTKRNCPASYRDGLLARLIDHYGDPRRDNPAFWDFVADANRRVLYKWLARSSMEAMFQVVTEAERNSDHSHHWPERRRFWMGLYEEGHIEEAWVALGEEVVPVARHLYQRTGDKSFLSFGIQTPRRSTSLLMMRIGRKIFVEGSHSFRIHVFPTPTRTSPQLYASEYILQDILLPQPHADARMHIGDWQSWVSDRIKRT